MLQIPLPCAHGNTIPKNPLLVGRGQIRACLCTASPPLRWGNSCAVSLLKNVRCDLFLATVVGHCTWSSFYSGNFGYGLNPTMLGFEQVNVLIRSNWNRFASCRFGCTLGMGPGRRFHSGMQTPLFFRNILCEVQLPIKNIIKSSPSNPSNQTKPITHKLDRYQRSTRSATSLGVCT